MAAIDETASMEKEATTEDVQTGYYTPFSGYEHPIPEVPEKPL